MSDVLNELAKTAANNSELMNKVYDDGLHEPLQEASHAIAQPIKTVSLAGRAVNALFASFECWVCERENKVKEMQKILEAKLENIESGDIREPKSYVAIPAIQALSYSMDDECLKNLYANLLAKSMYVKTVDKVLPAFVEIIKQLSPLDARVFADIVYKRIYAIERPIAVMPGSPKWMSYNIFFTEFDYADVEAISTSLNNIIRLGLLNQIEEQVHDEKCYERIKSNPSVQQCIDAKITPELNGYTLTRERYSLFPTSLGTDFYEICCNDIIK